VGRSADLTLRVKGKSYIPVTGRGGPQDCETSKLPYFTDNRPTDGDEVILEVIIFKKLSCFLHIQLFIPVLEASH
jgi:hypothetical protein